MKLLVLDNYDSFTYNLVQVLRELGHTKQVTVVRNDKLALTDVAGFDAVLLSPGPGLPAQAGLMPAIIQTFAASKRILGVCLGHQGLAEHFGGELYNLPQVLHGVATPAQVVTEDRLFAGMPARFNVGRYHSWSVRPESVPDCLQVTATDDQGQVLAFRHREFDVRGVQFHPESILTEHGHQMMRNWLN